jgi:hypothetical protein
VPSLAWASKKPRLGQDRLEQAGFAAAVGADGIAVHRVAQPHHAAAGLLHPAQQRRQQALDAVGAHTADQRQPTWLIGGVQQVDQAQQVVGVGGGADLQADRVLHPAEKLDMRAIELAGTIADPQEMRRTGVPIARGAVDACQRLFVWQ